MKKIFIQFIFILTLVFCGNESFSQDSIPTKEKDSVEFHKVLIIPFNPEMYMSDADKEIISASKIRFTQLVDRFRAGLTITIRAAIPPVFESKILFADNDTLHELEKIYASTEYKSEMLPLPVAKSANKSLFKDKTKTQKQDENAPKIVNGQLVVKENPQPKYINIAMKDKDLLPYLNSRYGADLFIFINQFDIKNDMSDYTALGNDDYQREIRIHYTIFTQDGKQIYAGLESTKFSSKVNDAQAIINNYFPPIAGSITFHLPSYLLMKNKKQ